MGSHPTHQCSNLWHGACRTPHELEFVNKLYIGDSTGEVGFEPGSAGPQDVMRSIFAQTILTRPRMLLYGV